MARRDEMMHRWFAGHGHAVGALICVARGSEGLLDDGYAPQEQKDGLDIIDWLSSQPWCSGSVGMIRIRGVAITACRSRPGDRSRSRRFQRRFD
jgi:predicted acyl esterase